MVDDAPEQEGSGSMRLSRDQKRHLKLVKRGPHQPKATYQATLCVPRDFSKAQLNEAGRLLHRTVNRGDLKIQLLEVDMSKTPQDMIDAGLSEDDQTEFKRVRMNAMEMARQLHNLGHVSAKQLVGYVHGWEETIKLAADISPSALPKEES